MTKQATISKILIKKFDLETKLILTEALVPTTETETRSNQLRTYIDFCEEKLINDENFLATFPLN